MARALLRGEHGVRADLVRDCLSELERLDRRIAALTKALTAKVIASGTRLTELHGIRLRAGGQDPGRHRRSPPASLQGRLRHAHRHRPLEASSGKTQRHRLNRGGNRQLNYCIHVMAMACARTDPTTRALRLEKAAGGQDA
jgi:transposase